MCDCYTAKCEGCGCKMSLHIADWCTKRENVHPYCNRCSRKLQNPEATKVFRDTIRDLKQIEGTKVKHIGQEIIILCDDKNAHGIYLN